MLASSSEKSTLKGTDGKLNAVASGAMPMAALLSAAPDLAGVQACSIDNPDCEACQ